MYQDYLTSRHWQDTRKMKLEHRGFCQICGEVNKLHVHHKKYTDKYGHNILYNERIEDLMTLCPSCHSLWHKYITEVRKPNKKVLRIKRLMQLGVLKNKAFMVVANPELYRSVMDKLVP
jgi:5-methylcytosine-specific restriction endonuclease McrA